MPSAAGLSSEDLTIAAASPVQHASQHCHTHTPFNLLCQLFLLSRAYKCVISSTTFDSFAMMLFSLQHESIIRDSNHCMLNVFFVSIFFGSFMNNFLQYQGHGYTFATTDRTTVGTLFSQCLHPFQAPRCLQLNTRQLSCHVQYFLSTKAESTPLPS